jgi:mono/diheme cytochrome c family protein
MWITREASPRLVEYQRAVVKARTRDLFAALVLLGVLLAVGGCRLDMHQAPRYDPLEPSTFFADGRSARPLVEGTVPRGHLREDEHFYTGFEGDELATTYPIQITADVLRRGGERYNIFCAPCHDRAGTGQGIIVQRGYRPPSSFHIDRLRQMPPGYYYDVTTNGFGAMPDYAEQIPPRDRWAIAAYIQALQLSQHATLDEVPAEERERLESGSSPE